MSQHNSYKGTKVTVMGLARTGIAAANLLSSLGAEVRISEKKPREELVGAIEQLVPAVKVEAGGHHRESFLKTDLIIISPGIPWTHPLLEEARASGVQGISEVELAYRLAPCPIIAITGTNGKSTTTSLVGAILRKGNKKVAVAGNIGYPLSQALLERTSPLDYLVAEVSSFQLEGVENFRPRIALVLNLTPDHLDRHGGMEEYARLKQRIFARQGAADQLIVNWDDPRVRDWGVGGRMERIAFSRKEQVEPASCRSNRLEACATFLRAGRMVFRRGEREEELATLQDMRLPGAHNQENVLAALTVGALCGVDAGDARAALRAFQGLEHRTEWVREIEGVQFINDSKGTNPGAVLRVLEGMERPVILLAGGRAKDGDFSSLKEMVRKKAKALVLFGEARGLLRSSLSGTAPISEAENLEGAVRKALSLARAGDIVLLSPACASFDRFADYADRGRCFKEIVRNLRED